MGLTLGDGTANQPEVVDLCDPINDEEEDATQKARRKLGVPEYDPDALVVSSLPKIMLLDSQSIMVFGVRVSGFGLCDHFPNF